LSERGQHEDGPGEAILLQNPDTQFIRFVLIREDSVSLHHVIREVDMLTDFIATVEGRKVRVTAKEERAALGANEDFRLEFELVEQADRFKMEWDRCHEYNVGVMSTRLDP